MPPCPAPGVLRWAVDVREWAMEGGVEGEEASFLLNLLDDAERESAVRYVQPVDQRRAIASRLLTRRAASICLGISYDDVDIKRTKGKKPFCANQHRDLPSDGSLDNFNFNVSHEGDLVILAAEGRACVCGVDVAAPQQVRQMRRNTKSFEEFAKNFDRVFTAEEWRKVHNAGPHDDDKEDAFRRHWSCKEAFVKARGDGLGFDLGRCSFRFQNHDAEGPGGGDEHEFYACSLLVDGEPRSDWMLYSHRLPDGHYCTVARGPVRDIIDAWGEFTATLRRHTFDDEEWNEALTAPSPPFQIITIADLVPPSLRVLYVAAGGTSTPTGLVDKQEAWHRARRSSSYDLTAWEAAQASPSPPKPSPPPAEAPDALREPQPEQRIAAIEEEMAELQRMRAEVIEGGSMEEKAEVNSWFPEKMQALRKEKLSLRKLL